MQTCGAYFQAAASKVMMTDNQKGHHFSYLTIRFF